MAKAKAERSKERNREFVQPEANPIEATRPATAFERWFPPVFVFLSAIVVYLPTLDNGFVSWDDDHYIYDNRQLVHPKGLRDIWTNTKYSEFKDEGLKDSTHQYYPLVFTMYWLEHRLFGDQPGRFNVEREARGFHAVNMLLHAIDSVVLLLLLHRLGVGIWASWVVASLFAVHPMHVASVAWTAEGKNILALFFYMLAMIAYLRFRRRGGWGFYAATFLLFQCALWSKTVALTFPVVLLFTDFLIDGQYGIPRLLRRGVLIFAIVLLAFGPTAMIDKGWKAWHTVALLIPLILTGAAFLWADRHMQKRVTGEALREFLPLLIFCLVASLPTLLLKERWSPASTVIRFLPAVVGMGLLLIVDRVLSGRLDARSVLRIAPLVLMSVLAADTTSHMEDRARRVPLVGHQRPFVAAASVWFYPVRLAVPVKQLPIYNLWNPDAIDYDRWHPANDFKWWLPVAASLVSAWALFHWRRKITEVLGPHFWWGLGFYLITQFPMMGWKNINFFQFAYVADHYIYNGCAGVFLMMALALDALRRRLAGTPLGAKAVTAFVCAALIAYGVKTFRYCDVWQDAKTFWNTTLKGNPGCWAGWFNLGNQYKRESDRADGAKAAELLGQAIKHYQGAIEAKRNLHNAYEVMDALLLKAGRKEELERYCDQEIAVNANMANPYYYKGILRQEEGKYAEALELFQKALSPKGMRLDADVATLAGVRAGICLMQLERWRDAIPLFELAVKKSPRNFEAQMNLGVCYLKEGELDKAEARILEAQRLRPKDANPERYLNEIQRRRQGDQ